MKLVGMGLDASIPEVPSYLDRLKQKSDEDSPPNDVVRWWFTTKESNLACDEQFEMFELIGSGVRVQSESEMLGQAGQRIHTGQASGPAQGFAHDFTKHFSALAQKYPVYQELRNLFSLALDARTGRTLSFFKSPIDKSKLTFPLRLSTPPRQVETVMNQRVFEYRRANSTVRNTILAVSGGVAFDASALFQIERMTRWTNNESKDSIKKVTEPEPQNWWWD
jgi:hypothetical protein